MTVVRFDAHRHCTCLTQNSAIERASYDPLSRDHVDAITAAVKSVLAESEWGSVELVIERGRVHAIRSTTSQLFLDELLDKRRENTHGAAMK